jgi:DNA-binding NarL/FixJ family response regulator
LWKAVHDANEENLRAQHRELPKYSYPDYIITSTRVGQYSRYGIDFVVPVDESEPISQLDSQKASGKAIYGKGYIVSERVKAEREKAEREKAEREKAEREKAERWELSPREMEIIKSLSKGKGDG